MFYKIAIAGCVSIAVLPHSLRFLLTLYLLTRALVFYYNLNNFIIYIIGSFISEFSF